MWLESALKGAAEISGDGTVNKIGKNVFKNIKEERMKKEAKISAVNFISVALLHHL